MNNVRFRVKFEGFVQGVGFRWTTVNSASGFNVTGWVRNCSDGSVEVIAEGEKTEIENFLSCLRSRMVGNIRKEHCSLEPATGEFRNFTVKY